MFKKPGKNESKEPSFRDTVVLLLFTQLPGLFLPQFRIISLVFPLGYFFVSRVKNGQSWADVGFPRVSLKEQFNGVLGLSLFSGFFTQFVALLVAPFLYPGFREHLVSRIPLMGDVFQSVSMMVLLYLSMVFTTLGEEIVYRGVIQNSIQRRTSPLAAILFVSLLFAGLHWFKGSPIIVLIDLGFIFIDSVVYGVIWDRSKSLIPCWLTHLCANWVGLSILFYLKP